MSNVLFTWQLGGGLGHLMGMLPLASGLARRGHGVFMAFRNLPRSGSIYAKAGIRFLQAPFKNSARPPFPRGIGFAHLLANTGFAADHELFALASAWRNLYKLIRPALIVCDHSPAALLAARGFGARVATIGTGFCCPPDVSPLPLTRSMRGINIDAEALAAIERSVLRRANWMLSYIPMRLAATCAPSLNRRVCILKPSASTPERPRANAISQS